MSDHHDHQDLDELASAFVDGLCTPAEVAQVEADPALAARVASLQAVRDAVRSLDPPADAARREAAITAALDAFDQAPPASVTSLADVARRQGADPRWLRRAALAVAVVLLALAVPLIGSLDSGSGDDDQLATRTEIAEDDAAAGDGDFAPTAGGLSTTVPGGVDLGAFEDLESLARSVQTRAANQQELGGDVNVPVASSRDAEAYAAACDDPPAAPPDATVLLSGTATVAGRRVQVVAYELPSGDRRMVLLDLTDCTVTSTTI